MNPKCIVEGCHRKALHRPQNSPCSTLCHVHYALVPRIKVHNKGKKCSVDGCEREAASLGLCKMHYERPSIPKRSEYLRRRLAAIYADPSAPLCSHSGCSKKAFRSGLCITHYTYERPDYKVKYGVHSAFSKFPQSCQVCGYSKLTSHKHRLVPSLGYVVGNVVFLCANCHRELHAGLIPAPPPYT